MISTQAPPEHVCWTQITYVFIDVEERRHDGVVDGAQVCLVPVDVEHSSRGAAACSVAGHVLQQEGLLTTGRQTGGNSSPHWPYLQVRKVLNSVRRSETHFYL